MIFSEDFLRSMRTFTARPWGLFSILVGAGLFVLIFVIPYLSLLGKEKIDFDSPPLFKEASEPRLPILPIFPGLRYRYESETNVFYLTIEKLGIKRVPVSSNVFVDNIRPSYLNSLLNTVGHLRGTPLPGERGNSVLFGHSALRYLFNPRNFQTIFTKIDELKYGDLILVESGEKIFKYRVEKGGLVAPKADLMDFASSKPRLTLLSCYPPGFKTQKYAVRSILVD